MRDGAARGLSLSQRPPADTHQLGTASQLALGQAGSVAAGAQCLPRETLQRLEEGERQRKAAGRQEESFLHSLAFK